MNNPRENTKYKYPVHPNPELDMQRRELIVHALTAFGVPDAEQRVVVAPAVATGDKATNAASNYVQGYSGGGLGGGMGGGLGGGMF